MPVSELARNLNLPNALTVARAFLVPWVVVLLIRGAYGTVLWVFALAGLTDAIDGYLAKRLQQQTYLGSVLDPLADKLLISATVLVLGAQELLPTWLVAAVLGRDLVIVLGAVTYRILIGPVAISPSRLSKANTFLQLLLVVLVLLQGAGIHWHGFLLRGLAGLVLLTTVVSGLHYVVVWGVRARQEGKRP